MSVDISSTSGRDAYQVRRVPYTLETPHGVVEGRQFIPAAGLYLQQEIEAPAVVFSQGWGECMKTTGWFGQKLAECGIHATMFNYPALRYRGILPHEVQEVRYEVFETVLEGVDGPKAILTHSEGTYAGLTAAAERDDITATLLTAPAGLSGTFKPRELVSGAIREARDVIHGERTNVLGARALAGAIWGLASNVVGRPSMSAAEVNSIALTDARPDLERALARGARIGMLVCEHDRIFPRPRVEKHLDGLERELDLYEILMMNHVDFLRKTEESGLVTNAMTKLLDIASRPKITAS